MKLIPFVFLAFLCSCGPSAESQNLTPKNVKPGNIQFFETYPLTEILDSWKAACAWVNNQDSLEQGENPNSLGALVQLSDANKFGFVAENDIFRVDSLLSLSEVKNNFPKELKFMWSFGLEESPNGKKMYALYAVRVPEGNKAPIDGKDIEIASFARSQITNTPIITISMTKDGAHDWEVMTRNNVGRPIAITMDHQVLSCPIVNGAIAGGSTEISGNFSVKEAEELAARINAGK
ncbi:SecDF P1 head subdomain-containing protein [Fluviicola taffensis]|uniref:SecDF P1 head subdomain-containing protein n=1 Tax=Fluviicola taffensis TaxID=191579 RepID=UPI00030D4A9A|nr:hypothetical protein [Fluviicola taffensis]